MDDLDELPDDPPAREPARCLDCRNAVTWAARRVQYGRCRRRGLAHAEARAAAPRCPKCMTIYLRSAAPTARVRP